MKLIFGITTAALVSTVLSLVHRIPQDNGLSKRNEEYNDWAGVVIGAPPGDSTFVTVIGTFVVPEIGDEAEQDSAVSLWVGIDGYNVLPLVQAGINVEWAADGTKFYNAFTEWEYEGSPGPTTLTADQFSVAPGDTITVQVVGGAGQATATALFTKNGGEPARFDIIPKDTSQVIQGKTIEWIVERQVSDADGPGGSSLLFFDTVTFTSCAGSTAAVAASSFPKDGVPLDMLAADSDLAATTVVDTSGNGDAFTVTWQGP